MKSTTSRIPLRPFGWCFILLSLVLAAGCGGGGGGGGSSGSGGGGSSGGGSTTTTPTPTSEAPAGQKLTLTHLSLSPTDVLAQTQEDELTVASLGRHIKRSSSYLLHKALSLLTGSGIAHAQGSAYPPVQTLAEFIATKIYLNGSLISLNPIVKYLALDENGDPKLDENGEQIELEVECDLSFAEVKIKKTYILNLETEDMFIEADIPDTVNADCMLGFRPTLLAVMSDNTVIDLTDEIGNLDGSQSGPNITNVIGAKDGISNSSDNALIIKNEQVYELELTSDLATLTQLTADGIYIIQRSNLLAYNGTYLLAKSTSNIHTWHVFEKNNVAFRSFRSMTTVDGLNLVHTSPLQTASNWVDSNGRLMINTFILNTDDLSFTSLMAEIHGFEIRENTGTHCENGLNCYQVGSVIWPWEDRPSSGVITSEDEEFWAKYEVPEACWKGLYEWFAITTPTANKSDWRTTDCPYSRHIANTSFSGTYGNWIYSKQGIAWNPHTFENTLFLSCWDINLGKAVDLDTCGTVYAAVDYSALHKNHIWIVRREKSLYLKYDLDTKTAVAFDLFDAGFFAQSFNVFNDVVLVEAISDSTSNKEYLELNLNSGELINRGVISEGNRVVLEFLPITIST